MKRLFLALALFFAPLAAHASNCSGYTYVLTNGQIADANQVMSNFNTILGCANNNLAHNGANADITSLSALSTPLTVGQGGTGNTTGQPSGTAGGVLGGSYPSPSFAAIAANSFLANSTGGSAAPAATSAATATSLLSVFAGDFGGGGTKGLVPAPGANTGVAFQFLQANGSFAPVGGHQLIAKDSNYTFVLADAGLLYSHDDTSAYTWTIDTNTAQPFYPGAEIRIVNQGSGVITITVNSPTVLLWSPSGTTGDRHIAEFGYALLTKISQNQWLITGWGIS